jgi:hypothetical protein
MVRKLGWKAVLKNGENAGLDKYSLSWPHAVVLCELLTLPISETDPGICLSRIRTSFSRLSHCGLPSLTFLRVA